MHLDPHALSEAHAALGPVDELVACRRAIYSAAVELAVGPGAAEVGPEILDNPAVRAHLADVILGSASLDMSLLRPVSDLTAGSVIDVPAGPIRFASDPAAVGALAAAVRRVGADLVRRGGPRRTETLLVATDPAFAEARSRSAAGVAMLADLVPRILADVVPHLALIALLADDGSSRLGSASPRDHPGLIFVPEPRTPFEVAEAVVHEGAHQKFFDLAMTRSLLAPHHRSAPWFVPSWAPAGSAGWPLEQCFAAFHAYCHLGVLDTVVGGRGDVRRHGYSLLPMAWARAEELATRLHRGAEFLGVDGRKLLGLLSGRPVPGSAVVPDPGSDIGDRLVPSGGVVTRECGLWTLVATAGPPIDLYWVPGETPNAVAVAASGA